MTDRKATGKQGEIIAQNYLKKRGYRILETNYRSRYGEIDIIAKHKNTLVFIEVRTKRSRTFGMPEESITETKARHLRAGAYHYIQNHEKLPELWRIDFVAVEMDDKDKATRVDIIESAIGE